LQDANSKFLIAFEKIVAENSKAQEESDKSWRIANFYAKYIDEMRFVPEIGESQLAEVIYAQGCQNPENLRVLQKTIIITSGGITEETQPTMLKILQDKFGENLKVIPIVDPSKGSKKIIFLKDKVSPEVLQMFKGINSSKELQKAFSFSEIAMLVSDGVPRKESAVFAMRESLDFGHCKFVSALAFEMFVNKIDLSEESKKSIIKYVRENIKVQKREVIKSQEKHVEVKNRDNEVPNFGEFYAIPKEIRGEDEILKGIMEVITSLTKADYLNEFPINGKESSDIIFRDEDRSGKILNELYTKSINQGLLYESDLTMDPLKMIKAIFNNSPLQSMMEDTGTVYIKYNTKEIEEKLKEWVQLVIENQEVCGLDQEKRPSLKR
jgi:hypothetical protein